MLKDSVARLPIAEQLPEIERRLNEEWERRKALNLPMSPANICDVLSIDKATFFRWKDGRTKQRQGKDSIEVDANDAAGESEKELYVIRGDILRAWLIKCEASWLDVAGSSNSKSAVTGASNVLNKVFGYDKRNEEYGKRMEYEEVLGRVRARLLRQERQIKKLEKRTRQSQQGDT